MIISIKNHFKTTTLLCPKTAKRLNKIIKRALDRNTEIIIDFTGIKSITLAFLYFSFKDLRDLYKEKITRLITVKNPTPKFFEELEYLKKNYTELAKKFSRIDVENMQLA